MAKKLILTADDYGYVKHIDDAVITAVSQKRLTTVSCFANISTTTLKENIERLKGANPNVGVGLHFTITSKEPLTDAYSMSTIDPPSGKRHFKLVRNQNLNKISKEELELELKAQLDNLASAVGREQIDHLTNHHNIVYLDKEIFEVYARVASDYGLSIRSPLPWSRSGKTYYYYKDGNILTKHAITNAAIHSVPILNIIKSLFSVTAGHINKLSKIAHEYHVKHPNIVMDVIYGQPYLDDWQNYWEQIQNDEIIEQVHHLSTVYYDSDIQNTPWGIDSNYFQGRMMEKIALMSQEFQEFITPLQQQGLVLGTYKSFL